MPSDAPPPPPSPPPRAAPRVPLARSDEAAEQLRCSELHLAFLRCTRGNHLFSGRSCDDAYSAYVACTKEGPQRSRDWLGQAAAAVGDAAASLSAAVFGGEKPPPPPPPAAGQ
jgi:hypothetical protein